MNVIVPVKYVFMDVTYIFMTEMSVKHGCQIYNSDNNDVTKTRFLLLEICMECHTSSGKSLECSTLSCQVVFSSKMFVNMEATYIIWM